MLKQKEILLQQIEAVEKTQQESIAQVLRMKNRIDMKINRILQLLGEQPTRNATEKVALQITQNPLLNEPQVSQKFKIGVQKLSSIKMLDKSTQKQENEQQDIIRNHPKQNRKQVIQDSQRSLESSTNQFLSMKLSEESSDLDIIRQGLQSENKFFVRNQFPQPLRLRHCESKSQPGDELDFHNRISEVPEEFEDEPNQKINTYDNLKISPKEQVQIGIKQNIRGQLIIVSHKNFNSIRKRSKTAVELKLPVKAKNNKNRLYQEDQFQQYVFNIQNYKQHKSSLCSVKKILNNINKKDVIENERKKLIPQQVQNMKKDYQHHLKKRRRETESGLKLRENLLAKFRYYMKKKELSMRF